MLPLLEILKERLSFSEAVVRNCSVRKIAHKFLPEFACNLIIKETYTQVYFCEFSKFIKKTYLAEPICKWLILDFEQFYMSHSILHFIKRKSKKGNYFLLNVFNRISTLENYCQKK